MKRTDFIESRIDVIHNIYTLYSYANSSNEEDCEYAKQRYKQGKWYVVELLGGKLIFAPSRFVGYKDNTIEKHTENYGNGNDTNNLLTRELKLYKEVTGNKFLSDEFSRFVAQFGISKEHNNFFIPYVGNKIMLAS